MKVLCVLLPNFPLRCEIRKNFAVSNVPAVLTYSAGSQKLVLDYSPELVGLQRGMQLQQALSLHGEVELLHADIPHYWQVFNLILDSLELKSPAVEGIELGCAYLDLDGLQQIYGNDNTLVRDVKEAIPDTFAPRIGIAGGKFLAYLAALYSREGEYKTLVENIEAFLRDLPCDVLPVSMKSKSKLSDFGIHTLGQIAAMPFGPVQAQFGAEGRQIWELARGHDNTPLYPRFMEEVIEENTTLAYATVSLEAILIAVESLLRLAFTRDILKKGKGIYGITLWTEGSNQEHWERNIRFKEPAMNIKSAISRIKQIMETFPQPGPVEQLGIKITRFGCERGKQKSLFPEVRSKDNMMDGIKQLELQLGSPQVFKIKEIEPWSRIPERRYALTPLSQ
jgi:DNA polymerase IV